MKEAPLKRAILRLLKKRGYLAWSNPQNAYTQSGIPDIQGVLPGGRAFFIECKAPGRYANPVSGLSKIQAMWVNALREVGALVLVTDSVAAIEPYFVSES